jgi:hypothetical protein
VITMKRIARKYMYRVVHKSAFIKSTPLTDAPVHRFEKFQREREAQLI